MRLLRVLIADDVPLVTELLAEQIRCLGEVELVGIAHDGLQALRLINELKPDVALLDISMPYKSGLDVLREAEHLNSSTIFVMFTADNSQTLREACMNAGATHYIVKTQFDELVALLKHYVVKTEQNRRANCEHC